MHSGQKLCIVNWQSKHHTDLSLSTLGAGVIFQDHSCRIHGNDHSQLVRAGPWGRRITSRLSNSPKIKRLLSLKKKKKVLWDFIFVRIISVVFLHSIHVFTNSRMELDILKLIHSTADDILFDAYIEHIITHL